MRKNYKLTIFCCFGGCLVQAMVINYLPLLFVVFQDTFGIPIEGIYKDALEHLKAEGMLEINAGQIALTEKGQDLSNYALAQFLLQ